MAGKTSSRTQSETDLPFPPGQRIPHSGIYVARHYQHRSPHEVTLVQGQFFPFCRECGGEVRFLVVRTADRLQEDYDFSNEAKFSAEVAS